jgi:hypothetical protein
MMKYQKGFDECDLFSTFNVSCPVWLLLNFALNHLSLLLQNFAGNVSQ